MCRGAASHIRSGYATKVLGWVDLVALRWAALGWVALGWLGWVGLRCVGLGRIELVWLGWVGFGWVKETCTAQNSKTHM